MEADRGELKNFAPAQPEKVRELAALYEAWAKRCLMLPPEELPGERPIVPARL